MHKVKCNFCIYGNRHKNYNRVCNKIQWANEDLEKSKLQNWGQFEWQKLMKVSSKRSNITENIVFLELGQWDWKGGEA